MRVSIAILILVGFALPVGAESCVDLSGAFVATAESPCPESPVLFCTHGTLTGDIEGAYDFVMTSQSSAADPAHPTRLVFTGESVITTDAGQMFALDHGRMDVNPVGPWPFETTVVIHSGDGGHEGATGKLVATGAFDPEAGITSGTYVGRLCQ